MSTVVTISGTDYNLPAQGSNPPWGNDLSDIITALVAVANSTIGAGDILSTSFTITNNTAVAAPITGLSFDTSIVRSAIIPYSIYISSSTTELSECGNIYITYKSTANSWELAQNYAGSSGIVFTITNSGQLKYTSANTSGTGYSAKLRFSAKAFLQT